MIITTQDFAQALYLALQEVSDTDHDRIINNVVQELEMLGRLHEFPDIIEEFEKLLKIDEGKLQTQKVLGQINTANTKIIEELNAKIKTQNISATEEKVFLAVE